MRGVRSRRIDIGLLHRKTPNFHTRNIEQILNQASEAAGHVLGEPCVDRPKHLAIGPPERANVPAEVFADRLHDAATGELERHRRSIINR